MRACAVRLRTTSAVSALLPAVGCSVMTDYSVQVIRRRRPVAQLFTAMSTGVSSAVEVIFLHSEISPISPYLQYCGSSISRSVNFRY